METGGVSKTERKGADWDIVNEVVNKPGNISKVKSELCRWERKRALCRACI